MRLFKMAANQCSRLEQRSVMKFFAAEKRRPCEIYKRMCDVYGEGCFSKNKMFTNGLNIMSLCQKDGLWSGSTLTLW